MKKIIFVFFVLLLSTFSVLSQSDRTFYKICYGTAANFGNSDFSNDEITVKSLTNDSLSFEALDFYQVNKTLYSAKKKFAENNIMKDTDKSPEFYGVRVDDNSFLIISINVDTFSYFHADKKAFGKDTDLRCARESRKQFISQFPSYTAKEKEFAQKEAEKESQIAKEKQKVFDAETKGVITDFVKNYKSRKNDPTLQKEIFKWWKNTDVPLLRTYFMQSGYEFIRNEYGVVLRKTIDTILLLKNKKAGKCYIQWRSFGYEALGNGFDTELGSWFKQEQLGFGYYRVSLNFPGNRKITAGYDYEVDCAAFQ